MTADQKAVLLLGNFLSEVTGSKGVSEALADCLQAAGWKVTTASKYPQRLRRLGDITWRVWDKRHDYQVAHVDVFSGLAFSMAELACSFLSYLGKPYILTLHGGSLPEFAHRWPWRVRRLLRSAAAVTVPSSYLRDKMKTYREEMFLFPNAIHLSAYKFDLRRQPHARLVWLRAFHGIYNPTMAPRVVALLVKDFPDVHLTMMGPDKGDGTLHKVRQIASDLGVSDHITMLGRVPNENISDYMSRGDIFLNTTTVDNTPVTVMEAMACGLCVISANVGGISHLLQDDHDALLIPPNDPDSMAFAVRRVLLEPGLAERLSQNGFQKVARFDWRLIVAEWDKLLTAVVQGHELSPDISAYA